jgi:pyrroline-5-carboxylate reductase
MPNTPAQVGAGVSAVCPVGLTEDETGFVKDLLGTCGEVILCDEKTLDAIGCVSGTGPAYVMLFIEALADAAVSLGIKRDDALKIAAGTVMGSGKLCLDTGKNPAVLKDMVCSPGGTTIAGVMALEENGFRNAAIKSVLAAYDKTLEMQKKS